MDINGNYETDYSINSWDYAAINNTIMSLVPSKTLFVPDDYSTSDLRPIEFLGSCLVINHLC